MNKEMNRKKVLAAAVLFIFFILFAKLLFIQIVMYGKINKTVENMVKRESVETAKRGDILDSSGSVLASSVLRYTLFLDPKMITDFDYDKKILASYGIKIKEKNLQAFGDTSYAPAAFELDGELVKKIKTEKMPGVGFESKYSREYPEGRLLVHILGITGSDGNGLEGIEKVCNAYLSGENVKTTQYKDGRGQVISDTLVDKSKINGLGVTLTIDKNIQFIAEQELRKAFADYKAKRAICIVQNPNDGNILAMVSLPDFDFTGRITDPSLLRNSAVSDVFEPGSTFKIVAAAAALEEKKIKPGDSFYLEDGKMKIGKFIVKDDHKMYGSASLSKIMEQSSNIGMVKVAQKLGNKLFYEYIRKFGFYALTGVDLPGEAKGLLLDEKNWNTMTLPTASFGQGVAVTALQLTNAFSAVANGGVLMKPIIIKSIENTLPQDMSFFEPKEIRRVISGDTAEQIKKLLRNAVEKGTGKSGKVPGYTTGGKTGTAQKIDSDTKKYSTKHYIASFCGMLPMSKPELVIFVMIDEPKGDYYAASVAAPVFSRIAARTAEYLNIPKDEGTTGNK